MFRAIVARGNYLSQDRTDIRYAVKELSRAMSKPTQQDWYKLKKLGKYLVGKPRLVQEYCYQSSQKEVAVWVDTDFAGCRKTRKSTSGGIIALGTHILKCWSQTQNVLALSSGEAEYYGMVKGASMGIGLRSLLLDLGVPLEILLRTDASAAKGISQRRGLGKVRQLELSQLWLQDKVARKEIEVRKVATKENWADALTKCLDGVDMKKHLEMTGQIVTKDRHGLAPSVEKTDEHVNSHEHVEMDVDACEEEDQSLLKLHERYGLGALSVGAQVRDSEVPRRKSEEEVRPMQDMPIAPGTLRKEVGETEEEFQLRKIKWEMAKRELELEKEERKKRRADGESDLPSPPGSVISTKGEKICITEVVEEEMRKMRKLIDEPLKVCGVVDKDMLLKKQKQLAHMEVSMLSGRTKLEKAELGMEALKDIHRGFS